MLLNSLASLLPTLQQDPTLIADLATVVIDTDDKLTFSDVLSLQPEVNFAGGLQAQVPPLNKVTLALLQKAKTVTDAGLVAGKPEVVSALVELWLRTSQTTVAEKTRAVICGLLAAESPEAQHGDGSMSSSSQGLMWRRLFNDKDVYGLLFSLCSFSTSGQPGQLTRREKTIAQGRLLDLVQDIYHAPQIWRSQIPEIEQAYGLEPGCGLLEFAAVKMIDYKDDVLIHMTLIDFFTRLISRNNGDILTLNSTRSAGLGPNSSVALDFLIAKGLHDRTMSYFLDPDRHDSLDATYLYSSSTHYISAYATHYKTHFLAHTARYILDRLSTVLSRISSSAWAANNLAPVHDLKLLSRLPQRALLSLDWGALLLSIPTKPVNVDALHTLGTIFEGFLFPSNAEDLDIIVPPPTSSSQSSPDLTAPDRAAARALFFLYAQSHPNLFRDLVTTAETVAVKEHALAAVSLLLALSDSNWAPLPPTPNDILPSESQLENQCASLPKPLPQQGVRVLLQPPAMGSVMPYLMKGPENGSEAALEVAVQKHAVVASMRRRLKAMVDEGIDEPEHWADILRMLERRDAAGPAGLRREGGGATRDVPVVGTIGR